MGARFLRLIVITWLMLSPLNLSTTAAPAAAGAAAQPIGAASSIGLLNSIMLHPPLMPLAAGSPQTITLEIAPVTLIANSGATAVITATVYDLTGEVVSGVNLAGNLAPATLGSVSGLGVTDINGRATGTWTAGSVVGSGSIAIGDGVITATTNLTLTTGALATVAVVPNSTAVTVGLTTTFTANGSDAYGNAIAISPAWSTNGGLINASGVFTAQTNIASGRLVTATASSISGVANVNITAGPVQTITVSPNNVTVTAGGTQAFTASGVDQYGNPVTLTPAWSSNGGNVDSSGLLTAQTGAAAGRLVTATQNSVVGTAIFNVVAGPLASIAVSPPSASVVAAATRSFTASGFDQYGNAVIITPTWTSNGGSIDAGGVFTAQFTAANGRLVTATQNSVIGTATVNVVAGPLNSITVSPGSATVVVGTTQTFTATGLDQYGNTVIVTPTWTTNGGSINSSGLFTAFTSVASNRLVTATQGAVSNTASVNIIAGPLSSIVVSPATANVPAGTTEPFTASGFDQYGNAVPVTPTWTSDAGTISPVGVLSAQTMAAAGRTVTATQNSVVGTAVVNVVAGPLASIVVSPPSANVPAGTTRAFTANGFDQYGNTVLITPTWTTSGGSISAGGVFTAQFSVVSNRLVTATQNSIAGTASVNVIAGPLSSITISPASANVVAGTTQSFSASGFDQYGNSVIITPTWTTNGGSISNSGVYTAQFGVASNRVVTATDGIVQGTASVNVIAGPLNSIVVSPATADVTAGLTRTFTANGFDQYGNAVIITPTWTTNGGSIGSSGVFTAQFSVASNRLVTATQNAIAGTANVNIVAGPLSSITVSPPSANVAAGTTQAFSASGFDQHGNSVPITPTWTASGGTISPAGLFTAQTSVAAGQLVTATYTTISGTASVNIIAGPLNSIVVLPASANVVAATARTFTANGFDQYGNAVSITPTWTTNGGSISASGIFTAQVTVASGRLVTATQNSISGTASVNITAAPLNTITVTPASVVVGAGTTRSFAANGFDQFGNAVPITPTWTTNAGSIDAGGVYTALTSVASNRLVTATYNLISGTAGVNIIAGPLNQILVAPSSLTMTVATSQNFTASGIDQYGNAVVISPAWTTNGGSINSSGVFTAQTTVATGRRITATQGITVGFAVVNLQAGALYTLTVQPPTAVISAGQRITYTAIATDAFGNSLGNVTGGTAFSIAPAAGGSFVANVVTPTIKNTWLITGVNNSVISTATLTVTAATLNFLTIENAPPGTGTAVNTVTLSIYNPPTVYAAAYDVFSNLIGPWNVTWSGTGIAAGTLSPTSGISTTFTPVVSGTGTIRATTGSITDTTGTITVQAPVLRISKTASPDPLTPGTPLQYTIVYTNTGNTAAQNVIITETYPGGTFFFSAIPAPTSGNNVWSIGTLAVNDPRSIVVFMTTTNQMPVGTILTNTIRMSAPKVATAIFTATTPVNALPALSASLTDLPDPARPDDLLVYTIQYRNTGSAPVSNVRITETYPAEVTFVSADPAPDIGNNIWLTNTLNAVGDNSRTIVVTVRVASPLPDTTILNNRVVVAAQEAPPYTTTQQTLIVAPRLDLTQSITPLLPAANSWLTYTLAYTNSGSSYAANTIITDALPASTSFVLCLPAGCNLNSGIVTWNLGQVAQQSTQSVTLTVLVNNNLPNGTLITNTARITSTDRISATTVLTSLVTSAPEVTLSNTNDITSVAANQVTTYTLSYANAGTAPAAGVVITNRLPANTIFTGCSACVAMGSGVYSFTIGTVNAAQGGAVTLSVRVTPTLPAGLRFITNTAAIATTTVGDNPANNTVLDVDDISTRPVLTMAVVFDSVTPYPGKVITYTLYYTNASAMDTTGVVITATPPSWVTNTPRGWTRANALDVRIIGNLSAGQSGFVTYVVTLPVTFTQDMTYFALPFLIQDNGPGGLPVASSTITAFIGVPDLVIAQVIVPPAIAPGKKFTATLVISNTGLGRACNPKAAICGGFYVDAFIDPATPPPSYPFQAYGTPFAGVPPINAGSAISVNIPDLMFTVAQKPLVYFKVDNFNCAVNDPCLPSGSQGGLVPEYNETNNVSGPITLSVNKLYLPLVRR